MGKPSIKIFPDNKEVSITPEETILDASLKAEIKHAHACGGKGNCSTCRVIITKGIEYLEERTEKEQRLSEKLGFDDCIRLACQTRVNGTVSIKRPIIDEHDMQLALSQLKGNGTVTQLGQDLDLAIVFFDIVGYTPFVEKNLAYDVIHILNRYYSIANDNITKYNGRIIDYYGDGILAVFGLKHKENPALDAVNSIFGLITQLESFNEYLQSMFDHQFEVRAGIHYGPVIVGTVGADGAGKFTVIGDGVNLASRIETANKTCGTKLLLSEEAKDLVKNDVTIKQEFLTTLKGKSGKYKLYEVASKRA
ncbi:MAG: adenylate/guanylate cyclase domain-containing protein [Bacteroidota bacterium]